MPPVLILHAAVLHPIDILHYPESTPHPMDFSTVEDSNPTKPDLNPGNPQHPSADQSIADVQLVSSSCIKSDGPEHTISLVGRRLEGGLNAEQLRFCSKLLSDLHRKAYQNIASPFYEPVGTSMLVLRTSDPS